MRSSKSIMLGITLIGMLAANPLFAKSTESTKKITPAEIGTLATIAAIDKNEILVSVVAVNKKTDAGVTDFAKMMIDQHGSNLTQILEMANKMHAIPLMGGEAKTLTLDGKKAMVKLGGLEGNQFDKAYVNAMVKGHQAALNLIDHQLMKTAKSQKIKQFLTDTRAVVAEHLEHAKKLQETMKS